MRFYFPPHLLFDPRRLVLLDQPPGDLLAARLHLRARHEGATDRDGAGDVDLDRGPGRRPVRR